MTWFKKLTIAIVLTCFVAGSGYAQDESVAGERAQDDRPIQRVGDNIRFSFDDQPWIPIIEHFAEEAGFSLQKIDQPPPGSFNYHDDRLYTPMEALDTINTALVREGYTLIRYQKMLILRPLGDIPDQLIEEITADELDERGKFEVLRCVFDMTGLEQLDVENDIASLVSQSYMSSFRYVRAAKKLYVKETGDRLRTINALLNDSRRKSIAANLEMRTYRMKHVDPESLLTVVRQFMGMDPSANQIADGSLSIALQPLGDKLYLSGTSEKIERFLQIAETVDAPDDDDTDYKIEKPRIATYQVLTAPDVVNRILQTLLEGRDVRMEQNPDTGAIFLQGRDEDHELVIATIAEVSKTAPGFAFLTLEHGDASEVASKLLAMFGQSVLDDGPQKGPTIIPDTVLNQIMVRGTPQEVELVKSMITEMDVNTSLASGVRTRERFVEMDDLEKDDIMSLIPDVWGSRGRENRLNIIWPTDRLIPPQKRANELPKMDRPILRNPRLETNDAETKLPAIPKAAPPADGKTTFASPLNQLLPEDYSDFQTVSFNSDEEDQETSDEGKKKQKPGEYIAPKQVPSVPGSPIEVRWTPSGLVLSSDDLDALDDLEDLIYERLQKEGTIQRPTLIPLNYCPVDEARTKLEAILGIGDGGGGGGGGGGIGGMMAGVVGNAMGGGAGDLLGDLFGGGGATGGAATGELEGDVRFSMDVRLNTLIVTGATDNDLEYIRELVNFIDVADAPHLIDTLGNTYVIPVIHRDPTELKTQIESQLGDYFKSSSGDGGQQNQQAQQQAQMMRAMQQAMGGGKGGGGSNDPDAEKPKATLGVDERSRSILVTGQEFIYVKVLDMVTKLDLEEPPSASRVIPIQGVIAADNIAEILKNFYGDKATVVVDGEESSSAAGSSGNPGTPSAPGGGGDAQSQAIQQAMQQQMMRAMQQRQGQGRGGATGGRQTGGGGRQGGGGGRQGGGGGRGGR